eukprot:227004-Alexandrium_andersonii.AAC.1
MTPAKNCRKQYKLQTTTENTAQSNLLQCSALVSVRAAASTPPLRNSFPQQAPPARAGGACWG